VVTIERVGDLLRCGRAGADGPGGHPTAAAPPQPVGTPLGDPTQVVVAVRLGEPEVDAGQDRDRLKSSDRRDLIPVIEQRSDAPVSKRVAREMYLNAGVDTLQHCERRNNYGDGYVGGYAGYLSEDRDGKGVQPARAGALFAPVGTRLYASAWP
jgi:hypothetical protein